MAWHWELHSLNLNVSLIPRKILSKVGFNPPKICLDQNTGNDGQLAHFQEWWALQ